jgi:DNA-binding CsgD family transcriptional regulator/tetratricopeptide (TPR) repeat protein
MLHGRRGELRTLHEVAMSARAWSGRAMLVSGDPGIGKSAVLTEARNAASHDGLRVLSTRGVELEATVPFAALSALVRPLTARMSELPDAQAGLLGGAFGFTAPSPGDPFAVAAATLNLLGLASTDEPILLVVDDAHWLDPASAAAMLFISGRLIDQAISLIVAVRPEVSIFEHSRFETLELRGLDQETARELMAERFGSSIAPEVVDRLIESAAGNPLALLEAPALLSERQRAGLEPLIGPLAPGETTRAAYRQLIAGLPWDTRRALIVAAAGDDDLDVLTEALAMLGLSRLDLDPAEEAALVSLEGSRLQFRHALVRSVAHHEASLADRREAHRALAAATTDSIRRAWHLAAAATGPDEEVATALELAGGAAIVRSGFSEAATAFARAADLSTEPIGKARRQFGAAQSALFAGELQRARTLADAAMADAPGASAIARIQHLRGRIDIWWPERPLAETAARLVEESRMVKDDDPDAAIAMLFEAIFARIAAGDVNAARGPAGEALDLAHRANSGALLVELEALHTWIEVLAGREPGVIERMIAVSEEVNRASPEAAQLVLFLDVPLLLMGRNDEFLQSLAGAIAGARASAALVPLATLLAVRADGEMEMGRLRLALSDVVESLSLSPPGSLVATYATVVLARIEALTGASDSCRAHAGQVIREAAVAEAGGVTTFARAALATLEQTLGNPRGAFELHLRNAQDEEQRGLGNPLITCTHVGLMETGVQIGRLDVAESSLATIELAASAMDAPSLHGFSCYGRALLDQGDTYRHWFDRSIEWHAQSGRRLDDARARLAYGERLRRDRHRVDARVVLRAALEAFDEAGAEPWAERARRELRAAGETTLPRVPASRSLLTPQEGQIARLVADGLSNRDIAARLFISPKTVEKHLTVVFRKLDVSSRSELIASATELLDLRSHGIREGV